MGAFAPSKPPPPSRQPTPPPPPTTQKWAAATDWPRSLSHASASQFPLQPQYAETYGLFLGASSARPIFLFGSPSGGRPLRGAARGETLSVSKGRNFRSLSLVSFGAGRRQPRRDCKTPGADGSQKKQRKAIEALADSECRVGCRRHWEAIGP